MRTTTRLVVSAAVLGSGLLLAAPASAQQVDCTIYPADCPIGGGIQEPVQDDDSARHDDSASGSTDDSASGSTDDSASGSTNNSAPVRGASGGAASLPLTGGEISMIALAGVAALGGGVALTAAGRKGARA